MIRRLRSKSDPIGVHLSHCYQGEYEDGCKYGDDDCPAKPILRRCPFCRSDSVGLLATSEDDPCPQIICDGCGIVVGGSGFGKDQIIAAWNRRD